MVKGSKSAYNGRIGLGSQQVIKAPKSGKGMGGNPSIKKGKDLRAGK